MPGVSLADRRVAVWQKGTPIPGCHPAYWRRDDYGYRISYAQYGNRHSEFGWEFDHIVPAALGGPDDISNLRPLYWRVNASRQPMLAPLPGLDPKAPAASSLAQMLASSSRNDLWR